MLGRRGESRRSSISARPTPTMAPTTPSRSIVHATSSTPRIVAVLRGVDERDDESDRHGVVEAGLALQHRRDPGRARRRARAAPRTPPRGRSARAPRRRSSESVQSSPVDPVRRDCDERERGERAGDAQRQHRVRARAAAPRCPSAGLRRRGSAPARSCPPSRGGRRSPRDARSPRARRARDRRRGRRAAPRCRAGAPSARAPARRAGSRRTPRGGPPGTSRSHGTVRVGEPPQPRDEPVPAAARREPGRLVPVGRGGARAGARARPADPALDRLLGLPLVPRDGARELRGRGDGRADEPALRADQGRPRGAARPRRRLHAGRARADGARRLADDRVPDAGRRAVLRRHLLPARAARRDALVLAACSRASPRPTASAGATSRGRPRSSPTRCERRPQPAEHGDGPRRRPADRRAPDAARPARRAPRRVRRRAEVPAVVRALVPAPHAPRRPAAPRRCAWPS